MHVWMAATAGTEAYEYMTLYWAHYALDAACARKDTSRAIQQ